MKTITKLAWSDNRKNRTRSVLIMLSIFLTTLLLSAIATFGYGQIRFQSVNAEEFYGSYYGQSAININPDKLVYLSNNIIETCKVYDYEKHEYINIYNDENFNNVDPYDVYLGGAKPLLSIENPNNKNGKELYLFRDSFGSSLAPLLISEYSKIILVDLRYINSTEFEKYIQPKENSDVLFMYNTLILNNSNIITKFFAS